MGSNGEIVQHGDQAVNAVHTKDLAEKWQKDLNEFVYGTMVNPLGRLRQAALVTEGLIFGGIGEIDKGFTRETAEKAGMGAVAGGILGTLMAGRNGLLNGAIKVAGTLGGLGYGSFLWDKYSKDEHLTKALDSVYKNSDLKTFNEQTHIANKSLGKEGFDLGVMTLAGGIGGIAGHQFGPLAIYRYAPSNVRAWFFNLQKVEGVSVPPQTIVGPAFGAYGKAASAVEGEVASASGLAGAEAATTEVPSVRGSLQMFGRGEPKRIGKSNSDIPPSNNFGDHSIEGFKPEHGMRVFKDDVASLIGKAANEELVLYPAVDESDVFIFDRVNNIQGIAVRPGETTVDVGRRLMVGASANRIAECDLAMNVAEQGARRAGCTARQYAVEGSAAYYRRESGNDYTAYLRKLLGDWTVERQAEAELLMTYPSRPDSPWNLGYKLSNARIDASET